MLHPAIQHTGMGTHACSGPLSYAHPWRPPPMPMPMQAPRPVVKIHQLWLPAHMSVAPHSPAACLLPGIRWALRLQFSAALRVRHGTVQALLSAAAAARARARACAGGHTKAHSCYALYSGRSPCAARRPACAMLRALHAVMYCPSNSRSSPQRLVHVHASAAPAASNAPRMGRCSAHAPPHPYIHPHVHAQVVARKRIAQRLGS